VNEELPTYATEVRFYRGVLKVAYETGSRLRKLGVLTPDAVCDDGRPLFLLSPESIQNARQRISQHRTRIARSRHNLPLLCPSKTVTV
jgi:hypothetical protein